MINAEDLEQSISLIIADVARLQRRVFARNAIGLELTRSQWTVLVHLVRRAGIKQADLANILDIEPITLVRLVDKLEAAGLVERHLDPDDRRVRRLYLSENAEPTLDKIWAIGQKTRDQALAGLSQKEQDTLRALLGRVKFNLSDESDGQGPNGGAAQPGVKDEAQ